MNKLFNNLLVSCPNNDGGLFLSDSNGNFNKICNFPSTGLHLDKKILLRNFQTKNSITYLNKIEYNFEKVYSNKDPHDIKKIDNNIYLVDTEANSIKVFDLELNLIKNISFSGEPDSMHINCINTIGSDIFYTCFGEFQKNKEYNDFKYKRKGYVSNLNTKKKIITKLNQPHSIYQNKNKIFLLNSVNSELKIYDTKFKFLKNILLKGYLRGLEIRNNIIYVGSSASRNIDSTKSNDFSEIYALDINTYQVISSHILPSNEIYEIKNINGLKNDFVKNNILKSSLFFSSYIQKIELDNFKTKTQSLNESLTHKDQELHQLQSTLIQRTEETEQQQNTIQSLNESLTHKDQELHQLQSTLIQRTEETEQQSQTIQSLNESLTHKDQEILEINSELFSNKQSQIDLIKLNVRTLNAVDAITTSRSFKLMVFFKKLLFRKFEILNYFQKLKQEQLFFIERSSNIIKRGQNKICVYTAIIGGYDDIKEPLIINNNIDYICFSDQPLKSNIWQIRPINFFNCNQTRIARHYKVNPQIYLKDYDIVIWVDSSLTISNDFNEYLSKVEKDTTLLTQIHWKRKNIFEESNAIINEKKDVPGVLQNQIDFYKSKGFNRNLLFETMFFVANLKNDKTKKLFRLWNQQINQYSHRDQISLPYVIDKLNIMKYFLIDNAQQIARFNGAHFIFSKHSYVSNNGTSDFNLKFLKDFNFKKMKFKISEDDINVIIPVFNALEFVKKLINSILQSAYRDNVKFIIINDGSNEETANYLENICNKYHFILISNQVNLGYCYSINKGLRYSKSKFKIILNSDTEVSKDWIDYLLLPFHNENIAITGPLSNAASYQSIPKVKDSEGWAVNNKINDLENINEKLLKNFQFDYPLLPIVNGFCMAIRNEVFVKIGYFDEDLFKKGYGEENDFCLRALDAGFLIALNMHCYIYHAKTKSFQTNEKKELTKKSNEILKNKYGLFRMKNIDESLEKNYFLDYVRASTLDINN